MNAATKKTRLKLINKVVDVSFIYVSFIINKHAQTSTDDKKESDMKSKHTLVSVNSPKTKQNNSYDKFFCLLLNWVNTYDHYALQMHKCARLSIKVDINNTMCSN